MVWDTEDREPYGEERPAAGSGGLMTWLNYSVPVTRIAGIRVRAHWSFFIMALVFAGWTTSAGYASPAYVIFAWGIFQVLVLFALVLLHELGHSAAAMIRGKSVETITLTPLGGRAAMDASMSSPGMEAEVTVAGPLVNLIILAVFTALSVSFGGGIPGFWGAPFTLGATLGFIYWANLILAVFNLTPAYPMDGGRIVRAFLSWRRGEVDGTVVACRLGEAVSALMILAGLMRQGPGGIIIMLIGVQNIIACEYAIRYVRAGEPVYEEHVPGVAMRRKSRAEREADSVVEDARRLDELLEKVSRLGMDALTFKERMFLKRASRSYRDGGRADED